MLTEDRKQILMLHPVRISMKVSKTSNRESLSPEKEAYLDFYINESELTYDKLIAITKEDKTV